MSTQADVLGLRLGVNSGSTPWRALGCDASDSSLLSDVSVCTPVLQTQAAAAPKLLAAVLQPVYNALFPPVASNVNGCAGYNRTAADYRLIGSDGSGTVSGGACFPSSTFSCADVRIASGFPPDLCSKAAPDGPFVLRPTVSVSNITILGTR